MSKTVAKVLSSFLAFLLCFTTLSIPVFAAPVAKPATPLSLAAVNLATDNDGYYLVNSQKDLEQVKNNLSGKYKLNADIALNGTWTQIGKSSGASTSFSGTFVNGGNYTISGVKVNGGSYAGLFGYLKGATIDGLNIELDSVKPSANYGGGLAGAAKDSTIRNVTVSGGNVEAYSYAGGLLGVAYGSTSVDACKVQNVSVKTRASYAGGLAGALYQQAAVNLCGVENTNVDAVHYSGGFGGTIYDKATVTNSYASGGNVTVKYYAAGGFASEIMVKASVTGCYAQVDVNKGGSTTDASIGGFAGLIYGSATVADCYANGSVKTTTTGSSSYQVGGFVGHLAGSVKLANCYSTGSVLISNKANRVGAFAGYVYSKASMSNCYYDTTTANYSTGVGSGSSTGLTGLSTSRMIESGSFAWNPASSSLWSIQEGATYPYFRYQFDGHSAESTDYRLASVTYQDDAVLNEFLADFTISGYLPFKVTSAGAVNAYFPYGGDSLFSINTAAPTNVPSTAYSANSVLYSLGGVSATGIIGFVDGTPPVETFDVTFYRNDNLTVAPYHTETVESGNTVPRPADPELPGSDFLGWFLEPQGINAYDFDTPVTETIDLYAKWKSLTRSVIPEESTIADTSLVEEPAGEE